VIGGVTRAGRLARDEPAMFVLPHSQTSVYFHATRYLLAADIEAATGPTEEWHAIGGDGPDPVPNTGAYPVTDHISFAIRDVTQRIEHPAGWPRCDSFPVASPVTDSAKLRGVTYLTTGGVCPVGYEITIRTDVPASALQRFLSTCSTHAEISSYIPGMFLLRTPTKPTPDLLFQIASSELVKLVNVECHPEYHLN
jgi:hypothetical protein